MSLKLCSLAARGLWIEMLAIMGISEKVGYLQIGGKAITESQLAIMTGVSISEVRKYLTELESNGVFSRDENGIPYCRRMVREIIKYEQAQEYGKLGGNPDLKKESIINNPKAIIQKLEATEGLTPTLNPTVIPSIKDWSLQDCRNAATPIAMKDEDIQAFYNNYAAVGWIDAAGRRITSLSAALGKWKTNQPSHGKKYNSGGITNPERLIFEADKRKAQQP